jgi:iron complex transport system ATP-binding protein
MHGRFPTADTRDRAHEVMQQLGLEKKADIVSGNLSHGDQKLLDIALALVLNPKVLLLDEPVASLDLAAREQTIGIISEYAKAPTAPAMVMVTHHLEEIPDGFTHALILVDGQIHSAGEIHETLTSENLSLAFSVLNCCDKSILNFFRFVNLR